MHDYNISDALMQLSHTLVRNAHNALLIIERLPKATIAVSIL